MVISESLLRSRRRQSPARRIVGEGRVFAARSRGDQQRCREQDRDRQRRGDKGDRCLHRSPLAMLITARSPRENREWSGKIMFAYEGIGIAMVAWIDSTVRVTIRHSDSDPIASVAAPASLSRAEATAPWRPLKPPPPPCLTITYIL